MPNTSRESTSPPKSSTQSRQFQITSFLPKGFGSIASIPAGASSDTTNDKAKRKRAVVESSSDEDIEILEDEVENEEPTRRGKESASEAVVIDLTGEEDDEIMPPPPVPKPKKRKLATTRKEEERAIDKGEKKKKRDKGKEVERTIDDGMWVDHFAPNSREELAIHAKKITDVSNWFNEAFPSAPNATASKLASKYRRLLVLSGPAGSGKTACLTQLAKEHQVEVLEWKEESNVSNANDDHRESMVHRFTSFLARAGMAPSLEFTDAPTDTSSNPVASTSGPSPSNPNARRLILLEDLPNISHFPTKLALRSALQQFLTSPRVTCPLVLIVSEALARPGADSLENGGGWVRNEDSLDSRSVCGLQVLQHPACREISFNPIAPTIMKKALNRILDEVHSSSSSSITGTRPSPSTLDVIIQNSNGDIRSALMSLQFLATQGGSVTSTDIGGKVKGKKKAKGGDAKEMLQIVTSRENSLFIFHALGKVLYNKRWGESTADDKKDLNRPGILQERKADAKLPRHLRKEWDRKPSKVDPDVLFAEAPIDSDVFLTYLHHNYPQFTSSSIESCSSILDSLSASDSLLRLESDDSPFRRAPLTSLYSFSVAVRGTLLGLPSPVEREKQVLRKSEWWENEKLRRSNEEGVADLVFTNGSGTLSDQDGNGAGEEGSGGMGSLVRVGKRSLMAESIPWLGLIKPSHANPFLIDLATFPPISSETSTPSSLISGAALGEKDIKLEEGDEEGTVDEPALEGGQGVKKLEEVEDLEKEVDPFVELSGVVKGEDGWYEAEDDIVDED